VYLAVEPELDLVLPSTQNFGYPNYRARLKQNNLISATSPTVTPHASLAAPPLFPTVSKPTSLVAWHRRFEGRILMKVGRGSDYRSGEERDHWRRLWRWRTPTAARWRGWRRHGTPRPRSRDGERGQHTTRWRVEVGDTAMAALF
jgi:hypothetical protein